MSRDIYVFEEKRDGKMCIRDRENTVLSDSEADIFGEINVTELVMKLSAENCVVNSIQDVYKRQL